MAERTNSGLAVPAVIITLLAALGIGGAVRRSPAPAAPSLRAGAAAFSASGNTAGSAGAYEKNGGYAHGAGRVLEKFFASEVNDSEDTKAWAAYHKRNSDPAAADFPDLRANYSVRFLIVTLPAPISPPLQYMFDSELVALQSAAGAAGYSLDNFDLPWTSGAKDSSTTFQLGGEIDITAPAPKSASPNRAVKPSVGQNQKSPAGDDDQGSENIYTMAPGGDGGSRWQRDSGVLLFRNDTQLLVILLVGETPTRGVNRIAMRDALDQIAWLEGWQDAPGGHGPPPRLTDRFKTPTKAPIDQKQIRIIGPTFSGSAPSLRNVLEDWRRIFPATNPSAPKDLSIHIVSGTATAIGDALSANADPGLPPIYFNTVQVPDAILWKQIPSMVDNVDDIPVSNLLPIEAPPIALLVENTVYGKGRERDASGDDSAPAEKCGDANSSDDQTTARKRQSSPRRVLRLTFPLHISALRSAYHSTQSLSTSGPDLGNHDLDLPDEAGQQRRDVIPTFSPRAAVYDQLVLSNLLVTIRREHIRYVGIVATDVQDLIFLVQQIRIHCPDTIVFTTSADIAFLHTDVNTDLRGMRIFTTYPLFNRLQNWTAPFTGETERQTFPSDIAHGVYNATLAQLDLPGKILDYGEPLADQPHCPVIQIGVVGRNDIWPLGFQIPNLRECDHVLSSTASGSPASAANCQGTAGTSKSPPPSPSVDLYPGPFEATLLVMNLIFLICAAPAVLSRTQLEKIVGERWWIEALLDEDSEFAGQRSLYLMLWSLGMLLAEIIGLGFAILPLLAAFRVASTGAQIQWETFSSLGPLRLLTLGLEGLIAVLVLVAAKRSIFHMFRVRGLRSGLCWLVTCTVPLCFGVWFVARQWVHASSAFALYAFLRATHLHSGVSPLMALAFLGLAAAALAIGNLSRVAMLTDRPLPPVDGRSWKIVGHGSFRGVGRLWNRVVKDLTQAELRLPGVHFLIAALVIAFLYFGIAKVRLSFSVDGLTFDILFLLLGFGVYAMFSLVLLRFVATWVELRHLLRRLYSHPSRYSYKDVQLAPRPSHLEQQKLHLYEARPGLSAVEYELGCARAIVRIAGEAHQQSNATSPPRPGLIDDICANPLLESTLETAEKQLEELWGTTTWRSSLAARVNLYETMAQLAGVVTGLFEPAWRMRAHAPPLQMVLSSDDDHLTTEGKLRQLAELFVAARVGDFIRHVFPHLINLIGFAMPAVLAMMLAISVYPFPAHDTLLWVSWTALLATVGISLYVFISINRNPIISMFSGNDPGQFNWDSTFTMHLMLFAVVPILTLLGAQFPHALAGTFSWIGSIFGGGGGGAG